MAQQRAGEGLRKFRMTLKRNCGLVEGGQRCERREGAFCDRAAVRRRGDHLVLV